jgi:hypothetical protein
MYGKGNYFFISIFEHANVIKDKLDSREVRENRVRKPYGWDSVELKHITSFRDGESKRGSV